MLMYIIWINIEGVEMVYKKVFVSKRYKGEY